MEVAGLFGAEGNCTLDARSNKSKKPLVSIAWLGMQSIQLLIIADIAKSYQIFERFEVVILLQ